jgi:acetyl-CoA decarbonylase/synthase complex subunit gamma
MALKGLDIFKLTPKTNCKECGQPTCMAFAMKVAQGSVTLDKCPHMSEAALAALGEATAPPMKALSFGKDGALKLGGETVLFRHDKTFVSKPIFAVSVCEDRVDSVLPEMEKVDYERISERMYVEAVNFEYTGE